MALHSMSYNVGKTAREGNFTSKILVKFKFKVTVEIVATGEKILLVIFFWWSVENVLDFDLS